MIGTIGVRQSVSSSAVRMIPPAMPRSGFGISIQNEGSNPSLHNSRQDCRSQFRVALETGAGFGMTAGGSALARRPRTILESLADVDGKGRIVVEVEALQLIVAKNDEYVGPQFRGFVPLAPLKPSWVRSAFLMLVA